jgi:uncharacterized protein YjiS (DUF1127 family)
VNTQTLPRPIPLQRAPAWRLFDTALERARAALAWMRARHALRAEYRRAAQAERELAQLSPQTLQDIGAPQGLIGQRRWQDEQEAAQFARILNQHGW